MLEQGTLVAPRLLAEEGVGRAKLDKHEKPAVLRLGQRREHPDPGPAQARVGAGRTNKTNG